MQHDPEGKRLMATYEKKFADGYLKARGRRPDRGGLPDDE